MSDATANGPAWLAELAPAHAAPPPGPWPLAPGWWGLIALVLASVALLTWWKRNPQRRLRKLGLAELARIDRQQHDDAALARELESLLRRYAVAHYGREEVARLAGDRWIAFVAAHGGSALAGEPGRGLLRAAYGCAGGGHRALWLAAARGFIRSAA
jgi:hypothetical protein